MHDAAEHAAQEPAAGTWLTIAEAAAALGVSVDTVRRRLKRGELQAQQMLTERGPVWRVAIEGMHSVPSTPGSNGHSTPSTPAEHAMHDPQQRPELLKALELLERSQTEVVAKAEAAAMWQTRAELLAVQLQQRERELADVRDELRVLQAPQPANDAAAAPTAPLSDDEHLELETLRAEHELNLHRMDPPLAEPEPEQRRPWWRRLLG